MDILSDHAIRTSREDKLNRVNFAKHIAAGILKWKSEESLCMALYGPWGSGKTSVINVCLEEIQKKTENKSPQDQPIIIKFQPWLFSGQDRLINVFLAQLRIALKKPKLSKFAKEAAEQLENYERIFDFASYIPKFGEHAKKAKDALKALRQTAQTISKNLEEDLDANKEAICEALRKLNAPIIIVVDDVDRLTNDEIRQLFQLVKAVADFPKTIYLLAFDQLRVERALEQFHEGGDTSYLEKIVQVTFDVPNPSPSQIASILWDGTEEMVKTISSEKYEQDRWNEIKFGPLPKLFRNVRDVKRYLNAANFMFPIIKGEVSTVDLLIIEAIHVFAPALYRAIKINKDFLTSDSPRARSSRDRDEEKTKWIKELVNLAPEGLRPAIKEMLIYLFPEAETVFKNHGWGDGFKETWDKNQRVCMAAYFDFYFQSALPEGEVSVKETKRVLELLNNRSALTLILKNYVDDGRINNLLPKVIDALESKWSETQIKNLIVALFEVGEEAPLRPDSLFFTFQIPFEWLIRNTTYQLLKKIKASKRFAFLKEAMKESPKATFFPLYLASTLWRRWYPSEKQAQEDSEKERLLTKEEVDDLKDASLALIQRRIKEGNFHKARHIISILFDWNRWGGEKEAKKWAESVVEDEEKIPEFLKNCGGFSGSGGMDSHYAKFSFKIPSKSLEHFCDVDKLKVQCEKILSAVPSRFSEKEREYVQIFVDGFGKDDGPLDE